MNTFSIEVSRRLREIGVVEPETELYFIDASKLTHYRNFRIYVVQKQYLIAEKHSWNQEADVLPAYTLHDIFRLMPKIGKKMGWSVTPLGTQYFYIFQNDCEYPLETLCARFREGDYEKAEIYLLDLLKEHE